MRFLRGIATLFIAAFACLAQTPSCTTITDTLYSVGVAQPVLMSGTLDLSLGYTADNGVFVVVQSQARQTITSGALSTCLAPGSYSVQYQVRRPAPMSGTITFTRYWTVPSVGGPYTVQAIEGTTPITPNTTVPLAWLAAAPSSGTYCVQAVNGVVGWGACAGSGGSGHVTWSSLGHVTWSSFGHITWSAI